MRTITENYNEVSISVTKRWKDKEGKTRQKTRRFYQTLNPFNLKNGRPKTKEEIKQELLTESNEWLKESIN